MTSSRSEKRLLLGLKTLDGYTELRELPVGLFGASTGAAAALTAAAAAGDRISVIVLRGGRPDLVQGSPEKVRAPTLMIVGGADPEVLALNEQFAKKLPRARLTIIPGASHLFEEPGALDSVALEAKKWFLRHFGRISFARTA